MFFIKYTTETYKIGIFSFKMLLFFKITSQQQCRVGAQKLAQRSMKESIMLTL